MFVCVSHHVTFKQYLLLITRFRDKSPRLCRYNSHYVTRKEKYTVSLHPKDLSLLLKIKHTGYIFFTFVDLLKMQFKKVFDVRKKNLNM